MKKYPEYKDSGIEWIGKVPQNWTDFRLNTLISRNNNGIWGGDPQNNDDDLVCVRVADFDMDALGVSTKKLTYRNIPENQQEDRLLNNHTLLIEKSGGGDKQPVGRVVKYDLDYQAVCSNFIAKLELVDYGNPQYMVYFFNFLYSVGVNKRAIKQTTGIQNLDTKLYFNERIFLPTPPEQTAIANFLDHKTQQIDELITKKERLIELLKEERTAIINHAVTKGLDPNVPMKDSGIEWLGEMPEHWELKPIKYLLKDGKEGIKIGPFGSSLKLDILVTEGIKVFGQVNVINDDFTIGNRYISEDYFAEMSQYEIVTNDILITMMGTTGKSKIVPYNIKKGIMDSHLIRLRLNESIFHPHYLSYIINDSYSVGQNIFLLGKGSIMHGLNSAVIKSIIIPTPPLNEQNDIMEFIQKENIRLDKLSNTTNKEIELLKEFKNALINEAVTGKIDVREYQAH